MEDITLATALITNNRYISDKLLVCHAQSQLLCFRVFHKKYRFRYNQSFIMIIDMDKLLASRNKNKIVSLHSQNIGDEGVKILASIDVRDIEYLYLGMNAISPLGVVNFSLANWTNILYLNLIDNQIGDKGCKHLSKVALPKIKQLNLGNSQVGSQGVLHLSKAKWPTIEQLNLKGNKIKDEGVKWLTLSNFNKMSCLNLDNNSLTYGELVFILISDQELKFLWLLRGNQTFLGRIRAKLQLRKIKLL